MSCARKQTTSAARARRTGALARARPKVELAATLCRSGLLRGQTSCKSTRLAEAKASRAEDQMLAAIEGSLLLARQVSAVRVT